MEIWKAVLGYEGIYEVSDRGRVRSVPKIDARGNRRAMRMHKPSKMDARGHLGVKLRKGGEIKSRYVHQLVLEAFVGPRPTGAVARHWNDIPEDNRLANLRWGTPRDNRLDLIRNGHDHNLAKTQCKHGHPLSEQNIRRRSGRRHCRTCQSAYDRAYRERRSQKKEENSGYLSNH